jgi:hypothetical protein
MDVILDATSPWASRFQKDGTQMLVQGGNVPNPKADQLLGDQLLQVGNQLFSVTRGGRGNVGQIVSIGLDGEGYTPSMTSRSRVRKGAIRSPRWCWALEASFTESARGAATNRVKWARSSL